MYGLSATVFSFALQIWNMGNLKALGGKLEDIG